MADTPRDRREWYVRTVKVEVDASQIRGPDMVRRVDGAADRELESGARRVHAAYPLRKRWAKRGGG